VTLVLKGVDEQHVVVSAARPGLHRVVLHAGEVRQVLRNLLRELAALPVAPDDEAEPGWFASDADLLVGLDHKAVHFVLVGAAVRVVDVNDRRREVPGAARLVDRDRAHHLLLDLGVGVLRAEVGEDPRQRADLDANLDARAEVVEADARDLVAALVTQRDLADKGRARHPFGAQVFEVVVRGCILWRRCG